MAGYWKNEVFGPSADGEVGYLGQPMEQNIFFS
jgi:hypothetical protein